MGTIPKSPEKNSTIWNQFQSDKTKNTTLWEQFQNGHNFFPHYGNNSKMTTHKIPHYGNNSKMKKKYHNMETIPKRKTKNTTLWKQFQNWIVSSGAGTAYLSGATEFTPGF